MSVRPTSVCGELCGLLVEALVLIIDCSLVWLNPHYVYIAPIAYSTAFDSLTLPVVACERLMLARCQIIAGSFDHHAEVVRFVVSIDMYLLLHL